MSEALFNLLRPRIAEPLTLLDIGAAGGALHNWRSFGDKARIYCFEAREDEAEACTSREGDENVEYIPLAVSSDDRGFTLHVAQNPGCSSVYAPIKNLYERYPGCANTTPVGSVFCKTTTVDDFVAARGIPAVDAIKLDTQGSELDILRQATSVLDGCKLLILEAEFNEMYQGQNLFCDVDRFLRDRGFVLWRFGNLAHYSTGVVGSEPHSMLIGADPGGHQNVAVANGQLFWADAFYVKQSATAVSDVPLSPEEAIATAALVAQWNFADLALELIRKSGDAELLRQAEAVILLGKSKPAEGADTFERRYSPEAFRFIAMKPTPFALETLEEGSGIVFGPYIQLPVGRHEVTFHVSAAGAIENDLAAPFIFDVAREAHRVAAFEAIGGEGAGAIRNGKITLTFENDSPTDLYEFRIYAPAVLTSARLSFHGVTLARC